MCLLSIYFCDNPGEDEYQVIIASNRDEHLRRATAAAGFWGANGDCLGGLDTSVAGGGTWLGMNKKTGRIGGLTNIAQQGRDMEKKSRGSLVTDYIDSDVATTKYLSTVDDEKKAYNNFHLILMERMEEKYKVHLLSSKMEDSIHEINPGVFVLGNSNYLKPWKKIGYAENKFTQLVAEHNSLSKKDALIDELYGYLGDKTPCYPDDALHSQLGMNPGTIYKPDGTKVGQFVKPEWLSAICVNNELGYGTRSHTLILIDKHGNCDFREKTLDVKFPKPSNDWISSAWSFKIGDC
ncbi:transport and Golgi organization 2 homolog [Lineus longissimus]|uniref:transport and Golgi organization 2 homolog n=1 Tax=Lineus longissimus TaxID=88925 RepID=UPI002B4F3214